MNFTMDYRKDFETKDSLEIKQIDKVRNKFYKDSIVPVLKTARNLYFPDFNFTDAEFKDRTLSDFAGTDVIINYTYLYCSRCMNRIDSTLKRIGSRKIKMIVLISERYTKELSEFEKYGQDIVAGFINADNEDLITLKQGDDCMYYLNKNRQIEYFDRSENHHREAWLDFLDEHLK